MKKISVWILIVLSILLLIALPTCKKASPLDSTGWSLIELNGEGLINDTYISLSFYNNLAEGNGGCNRYSGEYFTEDPDILNIQGPGANEEYCIEPEGVIEQEEAYFEALSNAATYEISDDNLVIYGSDNQKLMVFEKIRRFRMDPADLIGTAWQLESMNGISILDGLSITLSFDTDNQASGRAGVFDYWLDYIANGDTIRWTKATKRDGQLPSALEKYALEYTDALEAGNQHQYTLSEDLLEIYTSKGDTLIYKRVTP
jgi:heat shock protein HslJ